jgi:polar amino acid transport system substrate-binding protein
VLIIQEPNLSPSSLWCDKPASLTREVSAAKPTFASLYTLIALLLLCALPSAAQTSKLTQLHTTQTKPLTIAVPNAIPPYAIRELDRGLEIDIVRGVLSQQGYQISLKYVPLGRLNHVLKGREVDGAMTVKEELITASPIYFSRRPHVYYHNVAISLAERQLSIQNLDSLSHYSIAVFQTPDQFIGRAWTRMVENNSQPIFELSSQKSQVRMLFAGRVDSLVMDINIFTYYREELEDFQDTAVAIHEVLPKNYVKVAFLEEAVAKDFDRALTPFLNSYAYQAILNKYRISSKSEIIKRAR